MQAIVQLPRHCGGGLLTLDGDLGGGGEVVWLRAREVDAVYRSSCEGHCSAAQTRTAANHARSYEHSEEELEPYNDEVGISTRRAKRLTDL